MKIWPEIAQRGMEFQLKTWTIVGPWPEQSAADRWKPLPLDCATTLPASVELSGGERISLRQVQITDHKLDFREHLGGAEDSQSQGYAFVELDVSEDGRLDLAYGADWWAVWWLDGREVAATRDGNKSVPRDMTHRITLMLARGRHLLGVRVIGGSTSWTLWVRMMKTMPHTRFLLTLDDLLAPHDMVWRYPNLPVDWMHGAPIGNGDFGATVHGMPDSLTLTFGKPNVWQRYAHEADNFPAPFSEFRRICRDQDSDAYRRMADDTMRQYPGKDSHQTTCGTLRLQLNAGINPVNPVMRLRLRDGVMQLTYTNAAVTAYVSHAYDVLVVEIDRGKTINAVSCWPSFIPLEILPWQLARSFPDKDHPCTPQFEEEAGVYYMTQEVGRGEFYTVALRASGFSEKRHANLPNQLMGQFSKPGSQIVHLLATIVSSRDTDNPRLLCRERLNRAERTGRQAIYEAHRQRWEEYWLKGLAAVGDADVEKMYYRSLYLCGAMLRPGCQSPGLQGVWCGELATPWNSDYHANINIQSVYWGLFANNRLELIEPYLRLYQGFAEHSRKVAHEIFGMRGLHFPFAASLDGLDFTRRAFFGNIYDPSYSSWLAQLFWQYYEYSQDHAWLRNTGYPILRDVARFQTDYLQYDDATGVYFIAPSVHHERSDVSGFGVNAHYAQAWFRVGFQQAIQASEIIGVDETERAEWQERLAHLAEPPIENGLFKITEKEAFQGSITMVFPAELVSRFHGPEHWRRAALATWEYVKKHQQTESLIWGSRAWCGGLGIGDILRLGDVETAFREARWPDNAAVNTNVVLENGFFGGRDGYIQVDHIPGMCRVLADMMLLSFDGIIHVFPGIPADMPARFFSLRAPGGFLITAEKRGADVDYALVEPTVKGEFRLANPWAATVSVIDLTNETVVIQTDGEIITARLQHGHSYLISRADRPPESLPVVDFAFNGASLPAPRRGGI